MGNQKIVFNDNLEHYPINEEWVKKFKEFGYEYIGNVCNTEDDLVKYAKDAEILETVLFAPVTRKVIENLPNLKVIMKHGIGYGNIDLKAAKEFGISVSNTPGFCAYEVACSCILYLLAYVRRFPYYYNWIRAGNWKPGKPLYEGLNSIRGENVGIIGFGAMGRAIYQKLTVFEVNVFVYDPYVKINKDEYNVEQVELDELLKRSKYIILICPLTDENYHMIDEEQFNMMRNDAVFMNIARGKLVNEKVLIKYLNDKKIEGAILDVFEEEPISPDNPLLKMDNVIVIPHQAGMSPKAKELLDKMVFEELIRYMRRQKPEYLVKELKLIK